MIELIMQLNCHFTDDDKEKCLPTIHTLIELASFARAEGILALELEASQIPNFFLKTALLLVVDGTDPAIVKQILQNLILADKYSGTELLERLLIAEGVLAIQQGESPNTLAIKLSSMLGEKYMFTAKEYFSPASEKMKKYIDCQKILNNIAALHESAAFESIFLNLDNRSLQHIIHNIDIRVLMLALNGCGSSLIYKVFENVSINTRLQICENLALYKSAPITYTFATDILAAQVKITNVYEALVNAGEIIPITKEYPIM